MFKLICLLISVMKEAQNAGLHLCLALTGTGWPVLVLVSMTSPLPRPRTLSLPSFHLHGCVFASVLLPRRLGSQPQS